MMGRETAEVPGAVGQGLFATTHWSVVLAAGREESPQAAEALGKLCRTYWYPLYAYIRRRGHSPEDAQDLTQEFFARLLEKHSVAGADREKGRFRSFLLGALKHFLADEKDKAEAKKRGGGRTIISLEQACAEERFGAEPADELSPDKIFDRRWALTVLEQATTRLRAQYQGEGQAQLFDSLKSYVTGERAALSYAEAAARLGLSESAVKSAIYRLRRRYHGLVREEVAQTVADPKELEEEIRHLMAVFSLPAATFSSGFLSTV
jgi:RNA polymerase sigma-70 factor (ECF subfamily)